MYNNQSYPVEDAEQICWLFYRFLLWSLLQSYWFKYK